MFSLKKKKKFELSSIPPLIWSSGFSNQKFVLPVTTSVQSCVSISTLAVEITSILPFLALAIVYTLILTISYNTIKFRLYPVMPGRVAQSVGHLTRKSGVLGSIPSLATYFRFSFRFFKKGSCQLLAKVCARSTG